MSPLKNSLHKSLLPLGLLALSTTLLSPTQATPVRALGEISMTPIQQTGLNGQQFGCDSAAHATLLLHKMARDMEASATAPAVWKTATVGGQNVPVLVRPGLGSFLFAAKGNTTWALTSSSENADAFAGAAALLQGAQFYDATYRYPMYLDKFSSRGIGSWYSPYVYGNVPWTNGHAGDVDAHLEFAKENNLAIQVPSREQMEGLRPKLHEFDLPYQFADWRPWTAEVARLAPEELLTPNPYFTGLPDYYGQVWLGATKLQDYNNWQYQQGQKPLLNDRNLVDWIEPHGEIGPVADRFYNDVSPGNRARFIGWLRDNRGYSLQSLGKAWHGNAKYFKSWDAVPIPYNYDFYGWTPDSVLADKAWRMHSGTVDEGLKGGFQSDNLNDANWPTFTHPGDELMHIGLRASKTLPDKSNVNLQLWYRATITVSPQWLAAHRKAPIYLNAITLSRSLGPPKPDLVWLNGQQIAGVSNAPGREVHSQIEVTKLLRAGRNSIAYLPAHHDGVPGTFFLTSKPLESYPFSNSQINARFYDWSQYIAWGWVDEARKTMQAMRGVDPNRPIKMMAALDKDLMTKVESEYGAYGHNTGDNAFFRPWDNRLGYPRGVPNSAESSGSIDTTSNFMHWMGWFNFTGLAAFDNFYTMQDIIYGQNKDLWKIYLPYLHIANRRDIKKPQIALLWSSQNNRLLPSQLPFVFDLGRGDLQPLGYSYVYLDETGLQDGLAQDYPVLWDEGTSIMTPETVGNIEKYVRAGGTFVAIQDTGRHTPTGKDAWPLEKLSGFKVKAVRRMEAPGATTVTILNQQPLFTKMAGKGFSNAGKSVDYSGYNFADKCLTLEPVAPDTQPIARYNDGSIAIGMRRVGKGRVIVLGSPFWRDSYDKEGIWWPGDKQSDFLQDLLSNLNIKPLATSSNRTVWREHYTANNGTEEFLVLWNPTGETQTLSTDWTTVHPATTIVDPKNGVKMDATIEGNRVHFDKITLAPLETLMLATQDARPPSDAVADWFTHFAKWQSPSLPGKIVPRPDLPLYDVKMRGPVTSRVVTPDELKTLDLAALSQGRANR